MKNYNLTKEENIKLIIDFFHRTMMHHAIWFGEVTHQFGREKAMTILDTVLTQSYDVQIRRLAKIFHFELTDNLPSTLLNMSEDSISQLKECTSANWLASDGIWFQSVEKAYGMTDAKRINDSCWAQFSPFEAWSIKRFLNLGENSGLNGLKQALKFRLYSFINNQSLSEETETSFLFRMNDCRVQSARKRKGMEDYPCKSAGIVEYRSFAEAIDSRIKTECISCPPDVHPEEWYCAWKFSR
jgi:hypothetical protein